MEHDRTSQHAKDEELFIFKLRDIFDLRYVLKEGEYKLFRSVVVGAITLMLSTVFIAILAIVVHNGTAP